MKIPWKKQSLPTDLEVLDAIYERYYRPFAEFSNEAPNRQLKTYISIDIASIAQDLRVDPDVVFARLHYHLEHKYGYVNASDARVYFFSVDDIPNEHHCVNFGYLASVLADLRDANTKHFWTRGIAISALIVSIVSLGAR